MSDLDTAPQVQHCAASGSGLPEELLVEGRRVFLGRTTQVTRLLPDREIRMIGAWCFLDHYGPEDVTNSLGMQVPAHPHTGIQTVSWLFEGEVHHRDGVGSSARVRPCELNIMTAGRGIAHSEVSPPDRPPSLHGVQLWVALPASSRAVAPRFDAYPRLPDLLRPGVRGKVLLGEIDGVRSPATTYSPLVGADLELTAGAAVSLAVRPGFEYGVLVVSGEVVVETTQAGVDQLVYLGVDRRSLRLSSGSGGRVLVLGGQPFEEEIVMWWNFVGRSHAEIVGYRHDWQQRVALAKTSNPRFRAVVAVDEPVMEAPPMPTVALKSRPRRRR